MLLYYQRKTQVFVGTYIRSLRDHRRAPTVENVSNYTTTLAVKLPYFYVHLQDFQIIGKVIHET